MMFLVPNCAGCLAILRAWGASNGPPYELVLGYRQTSETRMRKWGVWWCEVLCSKRWLNLVRYGLKSDEA